MRILNLYAGVGGNRLKWDGPRPEVVAVEWDPKIADVYQRLFPDDEVVVDDAVVLVVVVLVLVLVVVLEVFVEVVVIG